MTVETPIMRAEQRATSIAAPDRRLEALVAAYIHELSPRHNLQRQAGEAKTRRRR